jgi:hypothetical protein
MNRKKINMQFRFACILAVVVFCTFSIRINAQEKTKVAPILEFSYQKHTDGNRLLTARLTLFQHRVTHAISGKNILFSNGKDTITTIPTDIDGYAYLVIQPGAKLGKNKAGAYEFKADFNGSDTIEAATASVTAKDVNLQMTLLEKDSVRTVNIKLVEINDKGDSIPVPGQKINTYVERMLSLLKISEETTDDKGQVVFEFPRDLPGEADGAVVVRVRMEDNELYGNVEAKGSREWGIPVDHSIVEAHRALWTQIAPVWMIITLSILLTGVWGHYIYVIFQMVMIKKEGNKPKLT